MRTRVVPDSGPEQIAFVSTCGSYASASDTRVHFELGAQSAARLLEITRPGGIVQRLENVKADQVITVTETEPARANPPWGLKTGM